MKMSYCHDPACERHMISLEEFLSRAKRLPNGCMEWPHRFGRYGGIAGHGRKWLAHRLSETLARGPVPAHLEVMHSCDYGLCVNPDHLSRGTHTDNMRDMLRKGRGKSLPGSLNPAAKLTLIQVAEIRRLYVRGSSTFGQRPLARRYGVAQATIRDIVNGSHWREAA